MASSSSGIDRQREEVDLEEEEDDQNVDELQCFDDFTVASSWERLISDIEAVCRQWLADGPTNLQIIYYLETLRPHQLLEQMVCTAFRASANTLNQTTYGDLKLMETKISELYLALASTLRCFQGNHLPEKSELIGDLLQLCRVFEHIEKLLILAASVHRKLSDAPRLSEAIFNDYFNFYLLIMGTTAASICYDKEFNTKELVKMCERDAVASLFPLPTANQSWRKVLSMGNLLNGHEPALTEIIFSVYDTVSNSHYGSSNPLDVTGNIETHRIYICGTSNDLQVALSVTSWD